MEVRENDAFLFLTNKFVNFNALHEFLKVNFSNINELASILSFYEHLPVRTKKIIPLSLARLRLQIGPSINVGTATVL